MDSFQAEAIYELGQQAIRTVAEQLSLGTEPTLAMYRAETKLYQDYKALMGRFSLPRPSYAVEHEQLGANTGVALQHALAALKAGKSEAEAKKVFWAKFNAVVQPRLF